MTRNLQYLLFVIFCTLSFASCLAPAPKAKFCTEPNKTEIAYRGDGDGLDKVYEELISCPNITSLDLDFVWTGCVGPSEPWAFDFVPGDRFPALRKLSL